jgi:anti-sigma factor RsiW
MANASSENHAAAAWVAGQMNAVQIAEFEAHLASCASCQEEVAGLLAKALVAGFALGWSIWQMAHH